MERERKGRTWVVAQLCAAGRGKSSLLPSCPSIEYSLERGGRGVEDQVAAEWVEQELNSTCFFLSICQEIVGQAYSGSSQILIPWKRIIVMEAASSFTTCQALRSGFFPPVQCSVQLATYLIFFIHPSCGKDRRFKIHPILLLSLAGSSIAWNPDWSPLTGHSPFHSLFIASLKKRWVHSQLPGSHRRAGLPPIIQSADWIVAITLYFPI